MDPTRAESVIDEKHDADVEAEDVQLDSPPTQPTWRFWKTAATPHADPEDMSNPRLTPMVSASLLSQCFFEWLLPLLILGYRRPLDKADLNSLPPEMSTDAWADAFEIAVERRRGEIEQWNSELPSDAPAKKWWQSAKGKRREFGIIKALFHDVHYIWLRFWTATVLKLVCDLLNIFSSLVVKWMITFASDRALGSNPSLGQGIGAAIGLYLMLAASTATENRAIYQTSQCAIAARTILCSTIHRRGMRMTNRARAEIPNSRLISHISADASRVEVVTTFAPIGVTSFVEILIISIILIVELGYPALAGLGLMFAAMPFQRTIMRTVIAGRRAAVLQTDKRIKATSEAIANVKTVKLQAWEESTMNEIGGIRQIELQAIRKVQLVRAANASVSAAVPVLATVISFVVYSLVNQNDGRSASTIFSALLLFNLLRNPLANLPPVLGQVGEAIVALKRLAAVYQTETLEDLSLEVDDKAKFAIKVTNASFIWDGASPPPEVAREQKKRKNKAKRQQRKLAEQANIELTPVATAQATSGLHDINLAIPRGQLVAIVGQVGSGKSSLVQSLIGEMKRTSGEVQFGGRIAYSPQIAWLQSATIRENILFGAEYDEARYNQVIHDACLEADLEILPYADLTQIGEKGISASLLTTIADLAALSGGQRQRVGIARCLYALDREIILLDDPLSALDAHVGKTLFDRAICGSLKDKTRVLVTNAIHVLPRCDTILVMHEGRIVERGSYDRLMAQHGYLAHLIAEFVNDNRGEDKDAEEIEAQPKGKSVVKKDGKHKLIQDEERYRGSVSLKTFIGYYSMARAGLLFPLLVFALTITVTASVLTSQSLVWWQSGDTGVFDKPTSFYLGLYSGLGCSQALFMFFLTGTNALIGIRATAGLHAAAFRRMVYSPLSFFESNPAGRILSRMSKDVDTLDSALNDNIRSVLFSWTGIIAALILVAIQQPYFLIAVAAIVVINSTVVVFYRHSARELKRLENLLRSAFTSHFSESLSGLSSIRAYGHTQRFIDKTATLIDHQNRASFVSWTSQRWLGLHLDQVGTLMVLVVGLIAVCGNGDSAQIGLALSYIVAIVPALSWGFHVVCEAEVNFNSVERVLHYANELEQEAPAEIPEKKPVASWPSQGGIRFEHVEMSYRLGLPTILKGLDLEIRPGESLGICGRTGAGKSSILTTLLRLVEPSGGRILIDGVDIGQLGLHDVRRAISVLPQDANLFAGTLRSNLDPFHEFDDARLNDALRRSHLNSKIVDGRSSVDSADETTRFTLDTEIASEGSNLSIGQRSLVSLARALVKDARIVCLDEATASVDLATDEKIQATVRNEFRGRTVISIAHRMKTLLGYDRVLVLERGQVAELDTPAALFAKGGIFKSLCDESHLNALDIEAAQAARGLLGQ